MLVSELITAALKTAGLLGVGQTALAADSSDALQLLNELLDEWQLTRPNIWHTVDLSAAATGAASYTVGPGATFAIASKPTKIEAAYARVVATGADIPLTVISARETWIGIVAKSATGAPASIFYDPAEPTGSVYPYPVPSALYTLHIVVRDALPVYASGDTISLPRGYINAMRWNLASRLRIAYMEPAEPRIDALAQSSLAALEQANIEPVIAAPPNSGTTPAQIIALAMRSAGVDQSGGRALSSQDTYDAFLILNQLLGQWQRKRWLVYALDDIAFTSTGALSYTVGSGGDFNVPRPDRIESAYARTNAGDVFAQFDWPVATIDAPEDYALIGPKNLGLGLTGLVSNGMPGRVWYDSGYPLGTVYFWPVPSTNYELHILVKTALTQFADLTTAIALPPEYFAALLWNLAALLRPLYHLPPDPTIAAAARSALNTLRGANLQVPMLQLPAVLAGPGGWGFGHRPWAGGPYTITNPDALPTTLPATAGVFWNNGGVVCIS